MNNQKKIIERLIKNNARLHEDLKVLRIVWLKKIAKSKKTHSSFIIKIAIEVMMNQLMNISMLNSYQECACKLFEKNCHITQCFRCHKFDYMIKFCRKNQRCKKCINKHHIKKCMMFLNRRCCNENHELWRCICFKWQQQMKQAFKIYRNKLFKYFKMFKYNHAFFLLSLNSLDSMNFSNSMNSFDSMNLSNSVTIMLKTCSWIADESAWQIVKIKKRWVDFFSCMNSDSDKITSEQIQKCLIRK